MLLEAKGCYGSPAGFRCIKLCNLIALFFGVVC